MKKIQLKEVLDHYDEKAAWAFLFGYTPPPTISELHKICDQDLAELSDNDEIPDKIIFDIDKIACHPKEEWTTVAEEALEQIEEIIHKKIAPSG